MIATGKLRPSRAAANKLRLSALVVFKLLIAIIMFFPIVWIISGSFKTQTELSQFPPTVLPKVWDLSSSR